ncbi:MAG: hypothetical protein M1830_009575 [Pleopsidium flavum]|nr:MAG: hypothetical protein M1830_009575 [Pleopsidium flavum]
MAAFPRMTYMIQHGKELRTYSARQDLCYDLIGGYGESRKRARADDDDESSENGDDKENRGNENNAPFNPTGLAAGEIFKLVNVSVGVPIGEISEDPVPRRMVLGGFTVQCAVMRRAVPYDISGSKISTNDYQDLRGSTVKRENIIYLRGWEEANKKKEEAD